MRPPRNIAGSQIAALSAENRFDAAYKAIMQLATVALHAHGYRTLTSKPGHHQIVIQSLGKSLGVAAEDIIVLDALRKQRNLSDYSGDTVPESAVTECFLHARAIDTALRSWLRKHHPELV